MGTAEFPGSDGPDSPNQPGIASRGGISGDDTGPQSSESEGGGSRGDAVSGSNNAGVPLEDLQSHSSVSTGVDAYTEVGLTSSASSRMGLTPFLPGSKRVDDASISWWSHANSYVLRASLLASISSALLGYDIGVTSGALIFVSETFSMDHVQQETFVGILNLVSLAGALVSGRLADAIGRRMALLAASVIFFSGSLCMALAGSYTVLMIGRVITGIGVGFGLAVPPLYIAEIAPATNRGSLVSLGEVFINIGILLGFLASFVIGWILAPALAWRWMLGLGISLAAALAIAIIWLPESPRWLIMHGFVGEGELVLMRTSGDEMEAQRRYWEILDAAGLSEEATLAAATSAAADAGIDGRAGSEGFANGGASSPVMSPGSLARRLQKQGGGGGVGGMEGVDEKTPMSQDSSPAKRGPMSPSKMSIEMMPLGQADKSSDRAPLPAYLSSSVIRPMEGAGGHNVWKEFLWPTPAVRRMLVIMIGINFFQQATGIDATVYYSPVVFREAGLQGNQALLGATVLMGFIKVSFVFISMCLLDRYGRRPLLITSVAGMMGSLILQGVGFAALNASGTAHSFGLPAVLAVLASCTFVAFFSIGLGPINWLLSSEIFPLRLRAQAIGLGTAVNRIASGVVAMTFLSLGDATGPAGPFFIFAGMCLLAIVFFYFFAPETKGKSLEQIVRMFERPNYARHPEDYEEAPGGLARYDGNNPLTGDAERGTD